MTEKISIVTDEISQELTECEEFLGVQDLHAVELRCVGGRRVPDLAASDRERLIQWSRRGDPVLVAISPGLFKCQVDDHAETGRHLGEVLPRTLDLALELGVENLISFTFDAAGREAAGLPSAALEAFQAAAEACTEAGIALLLENEPGYLATTGAQTMQLIEAVGHANLFVNWDPTNGNEFGTEQLAEATRRIVPRLRNVHVKNGVLSAGELFARCGPLREGEIDWTAHLSQLLEIGYDGYFALETHFLPCREGSAQILGELREMLAEAGYEWSDEE